MAPRFVCPVSVDAVPHGVPICVETPPTDPHLRLPSGPQHPPSELQLRIPSLNLCPPNSPVLPCSHSLQRVLNVHQCSESSLSHVS